MHIPLLLQFLLLTHKVIDLCLCSSQSRSVVLDQAMGTRRFVHGTGRTRTCTTRDTVQIGTVNRLEQRFRTEQLVTLCTSTHQY